MRVVFDASSIVGAALKAGSTPMRALRAAPAYDTIVISVPVLAEIGDVLHRPKFVASIPADRRAHVLEALTGAAEWFDPVAAITDCADPNDNKYLDLALAAATEIVVSSDRHLFGMHPWRGVMILRPADHVALRQSVP